MQNMNRKKFFGFLGKSSIVAAIASIMPYKYFSNAFKNSLPKIKVTIHPSAVKRSEKV
jgi:hypothetical protein